MATERSFANMLKTEKPLQPATKKKSVWEGVLQVLQSRQTPIGMLTSDELMKIVNEQKAKRRG